MRVIHYTLEVSTPGRGLVSIQPAVNAWVSKHATGNGMLNVFIQHTSASLLIQENADPDVCADLDRFLSRLVKDGDPIFKHTAEGPDDMSAHVRSALTATQMNVPVLAGKLGLGTWQGIYVFEHRTHPHRRKVILSYVGD
ncbi:MAG: secondary thiamine-phosphate synthase enzyme YjbQ [Myxococcaceae bacterium]